MWKQFCLSPFSRNHPTRSAKVRSLLLSVLKPIMTDSQSRHSSLKKTPEKLHLKKTMSEWQFSPSSILENNLPLDPETEVYIRLNVKGAIFSHVQPSPLVKNVKLVSYSEDVLVNILNMHPSIVQSEDFVRWIAGSNVLSSSIPLAHRYGGHQFGSWAAQLGDGRALSLGEYVSQDGQRWDIQLKGSGLTPYSRGGDGRAVLRSSIREFLCSEAMHALGIPTSRAAALVVSDDPVIRDQFYDGRPEIERAAIVMRIAPSFLRFGSLEILTSNNELSELRRLLNYVLKLRTDIIADDDQKYLALLAQVINESIKLVVAWTSVGFTHGVLNTDNMSLFGITIDYGPFGFLENYDNGYTPNASDSGSRYCFSEQLEVVHWNLEKLVRAVRPLLSGADERKAEILLQNAVGAGQTQIMTAFYEKLGLKISREDSLFHLLIKMLEETSSDFTMTFRQLGFVTIDEMLDPKVVEKHWALNRFSKSRRFKDFVQLYKQYMVAEGLTDEDRRRNMLKRNPQYVLRNWMAQEAIKLAEKDDFSSVNFLLEVLNNPFSINEEAEKRGFSGPAPSWANCIKVSCSS